MHYHRKMTAHGQALVHQLSALVGEVDNILVAFHLSETNGLCWSQTWMVCMTDEDANHPAIPHPLKGIEREGEHKCFWY